MSYKFEGGARHAVALYTSQEAFFNTESGSVDKARKKKGHVLSLIGLRTNIHLSTMFGA